MWRSLVDGFRQNLECKINDSLYKSKCSVPDIMVYKYRLVYLLNRNGTIGRTLRFLRPLKIFPRNIFYQSCKMEADHEDLTHVIRRIVL